jgi:hypothetical protein
MQTGSKVKLRYRPGPGPGPGSGFGRTRSSLTRRVRVCEWGRDCKDILKTGNVTTIMSRTCSLFTYYYSCFNLFNLCVWIINYLCHYYCIDCINTISVNFVFIQKISNVCLRKSFCSFITKFSINFRID